MGKTLAIGKGARDRALEVLAACYDGRAYGHALLEERQATSPLSPADAGLAAEIVAGVLRNRITAEHIAAQFYKGRWAGLQVDVRLIMAIGVYQLCWLERIPDHAAVDIAASQARRHGRHTASVVNAVLRSVAGSRGPMEAAAEPLDARRFLPVEGVRGRLFSENVFPDPARRPLDYLVAATGHPPFLVERWHRRFKPARTRQICDAGRRRPPLVLRPNRMRVQTAELVSRLEERGLRPRVLEETRCVLVEDAPAAGTLPEVVEGLCQPQDSTAQLAVQMARPAAGELILDFCAGAGTKSTQAAEMTGDAARIIATDVNVDRMELIAASAARLGLNGIRAVRFDELDAALAEAGQAPDVLLVDAPCSNTGVLARRPEARYRASWRSLTEIVQLQRDVLAQAARHAGVNTRMVYSTCSIEEEENEQQVRGFLDSNADWSLAEERLTLPDQERDGGYVAILTRSDQTRTMPA